MQTSTTHTWVWTTSTSSWADHKARPTIKVWTGHADRQERIQNGVKRIITPGSHVARLVANIGVNHVAITLGKDNKLDMVRNMACARQNNAVRKIILILEDNRQTQTNACRCSACKNAKPCTNYCINLVVRDVGLTVQPVGEKNPR